MIVPKYKTNCCIKYTEKPAWDLESVACSNMQIENATTSLRGYILLGINYSSAHFSKTSL